MNLKYWRGRLVLRLAKLFDRWAWFLTRQAKRDLGDGAVPDDDLFYHRNDWGGR